MANLSNINNKFLVTTGGNVGIGVTGPVAPLDVFGAAVQNGSTPGIKLSSSNTQQTVFAIGNTGTRQYELAVGGTTSSVPGAFYIYDNNASDFRITLATSGNVGIGTNSPNSILHVGSTGSNAYSSTITKGSNMKGILNTISSNTDDMVGIYFATGATTEGQHWSGITGSRTDSTSHWGTQLNFYTHNNDVANLNDATQKMVIKGDGNVGIGETSPTRQLHLKRTSGDVRGIMVETTVATSYAEVQVKAASEFRIGTGGSSTVPNGQIYVYDATAGAHRFDIDANGNVGIGITSPSSYDSNADNLVIGSTGANDKNGITIVGGDTDGRGAIYFADTTQNSAGYITYFHSNNSMLFGTSDSTRLTIDSSGNVGINETDPSGYWGQANNIVIDTSGNGGITIKSTSAGNGRLVFTDTKSATAGNTDGGMITYNHTDDEMRFQTNGSQKMVIDSSGNVGINETNPDRILHINSSNVQIAALIESTNTTSTQLNFKNGSTTNNGGFIKTTGDNIILTANNTSATHLVVASGGNVAIGATSSSSRLKVSGPNTSSNPLVDLVASGTGSFQRGVRLLNGGMNSGDEIMYAVGRSDNSRNMGQTYFHYAGDGSTSNRISMGLHSVDDVFNIVGTGNVGIGTDSPTYKFHVANSNNVSIFEDTSDANGASFLVFNVPGAFAIGSIGRNGTTNSVSFNTSSDYRLKEDLKDFNALELVNNIKAYDYKWKNTEQRDYGFVAHELEKTLPNVVTGEKDGEKMQGVDYSKLTPILLKAIQELEARVKELENK